MKEIETSVSLYDACFDSLKFDSQGTLILRIKAWNGALLEVKFVNCLAFRQIRLGDLAGLFEIEEEDPFFELALRRNFTTFPVKHNFKHYGFLDVDGAAALNVVAETVSIDKVATTQFSDL